MKVLFVGIPGVNKRLALKNLLRATAILFPNNRIFTEENGEIPIIENEYYGEDPITFLKKDEGEQRDQWKESFTTILKKFKRHEGYHQFLGMHLIHRLKQIPFCIANIQRLTSWHPDCIITFIDDTYCIRARHQKRRYEALKLSELITWRAEEILVGDIIARSINAKKPPPNYVVAVKHPASMLARLIFKKEVARIYISFPITDALGKEEVREKVDKFRRYIHSQQNCVVFDPLTIDEIPITKIHPSGKFINFDGLSQRHRWPIFKSSDSDLFPLVPDDDLYPDYPIKFLKEEVDSAQDAILAQVHRRDLRMINQAHYTVVYRPTIAGSSVIPQGVGTEIKHAESQGCPLLMFIKEGEDQLPTSPLYYQRNPGDDPNFFYEPTEENFWKRIAEIHKRLDKKRDDFLS